MILNSTQVKQYLYSAGFRGIALNYAVLIAECESGFNTNAHNTKNEDSRGLMQINVNAHPELSNLNLFDPEINTIEAYKIYLQSGKNFNAWTCAEILNLKNPNKIYFGIGLAFVVSALYISIAR